jgi:hypothetical protein
MASPALPSSRPSRCFRSIQRHAAQIVAVVLDQVEGVELDLVFVLARMQAVEIGHAVDAQRRRCCGLKRAPGPMAWR